MLLMQKQEADRLRELVPKLEEVTMLKELSFLTVLSQEISRLKELLYLRNVDDKPKETSAKKRLKRMERLLG